MAVLMAPVGRAWSTKQQGLLPGGEVFLRRDGPQITFLLAKGGCLLPSRQTDPLPLTECML